MLYIAAIIIGTAAALAMRGRISNIFDFKLHNTWIIILAFCIQIIVQILFYKGVNIEGKYTFCIQLAVFSLLSAGLWLNRRYLGILAAGAGFLMNAIVMMANGGKMPVDLNVLVNNNVTEAVEFLLSGADVRHIVIDDSTKLVFLADIIHPPGFFSFMMEVVSIGDLVIVVGLLILTFEIIRGKKLGIK